MYQMNMLPIFKSLNCSFFQNNGIYTLRKKKRRVKFIAEFNSS